MARKDKLHWSVQHGVIYLLRDLGFVSGSLTPSFSALAAIIRNTEPSLAGVDGSKEVVRRYFAKNRTKAESLLKLAIDKRQAYVDARNEKTFAVLKSKEQQKEERRLRRLDKKIARIERDKNAPIGRTDVPNRPERKRITKAEFEAFYWSRAWRELRYLALKKYGATCQCCNTKNKVMHVDHIKPRSKFPHLELDLSNLQVLCEDCNMGKGGWDQTDWRGDVK